MIRTLIIALTLILSSCASTRQADDIGEMDITNFEVVDVVSEGLPQQLALKVEFRNKSKRFTVREARLRVGIGARRSVALTLAEPLHIKRGENELLVPIDLTIAHNSRTSALKKALKEHRSALITLDGEVKVRRGIGNKKITINPATLREMLAERLLDELWKAIDENIKDEK